MTPTGRRFPVGDVVVLRPMDFVHTEAGHGASHTPDFRITLAERFD
jgi:hypothetical protein